MTGTEPLNSDANVQRVLDQIDHDLIESPVLEDVFRVIDLAAYELFKHDRIVISLYVHHRHRVEHTYVSGKPIPGLEQGVLHSITNEAAEIWFAKKKAFKTHTDKIPARDDLEVFDAVAQAAGLHSWIMAPIHWQGQPVGSLMLRSTKVDAFTDNDLIIADLLATKIAGVVANAHDVSELHFESKLRESLLELSRLVSSAHDLTKIQEEFGQIACSLVGADRVTITVPDESDIAVTNVLVYGHEIENLGIGSQPLPDGTSAASWLPARGAYVLTEDIANKSLGTTFFQDLSSRAGLNSTLIAPIVWHGESIAAVTFRAVDIDVFTELHIEIADAIANQVAGAIATHIAYNHAQSESYNRDLLGQLGRAITSSQSLDDSFSEVSELITKIIPSDRLAVTLPAESETSPRRMYSYGMDVGAWVRKNTSTGRSDMSEYFVSNPTPVIVRDDDPKFSRDIATTSKVSTPAGLRSWMAAPLMWQNELLGIIHFRSKVENAYDQFDLELAGQIASQIAGAVANIIAYENRASEVNEREILGNIGRIISSSQDLDETFDQFAEMVNQLIPTDRFSLTLDESDGDNPVLLFSHGIAVAGFASGQITPSSPQIASLIDETREPTILTNDIPSIRKDLAVADKFFSGSGLVSWMIAPMFWRERLLGYLHFRSKTENAYGESELRIAGEIAAQITGAVAGSVAYQKLESEVKIRSALAEISRAVTSNDDMAIVIPKIKKLSESLIKFDAMSIGAYDAEMEQIRDLHVEDDGTEKPLSKTFPAAQSLAINAIKTGNVHYASISSAKQIRHLKRSATAFRRGFRSFLSAPLNSNDQTIGILQFRSNSENAYTESDIEIVQQIADQIAGAFGKWIANEQVRLQAAALESADNAIVITSPDGIIEWVNSAFTRLTGWDSTEAIGESTKILKSVDPTNWHEDEDIWRTIRNGHSWNGIHTNRKKDGTEFPEELTVTPVMGLNGEITHLIGIKQDITERINAEMEHENAIRIESENRELQRIAAARSEFLSTVSHELRTPLTTVSAFADILYNSRSENLTDRQHQHLELIRKSSTHLSLLIDDLLDVSQADAGHLVVEKSSFSLADMIEDVADSARVLLAARDQQLDLVNANSESTLNADRSRVIQILSNLLTNASKFSQRASTVSLKASTENGHVEFTISDQGAGISAIDQASIFNPFFRGTISGSTHTVGSGLGLSVVKSLVDLHDGEIAVQSEIGEGTVVKVTLPGVSSAPSAK